MKVFLYTQMAIFSYQNWKLALPSAKNHPQQEQRMIISFGFDTLSYFTTVSIALSPWYPGSAAIFHSICAIFLRPSLPYSFTFHFWLVRSSGSWTQNPVPFPHIQEGLVSEGRVCRPPPPAQGSQSTLGAPMLFWTCLLQREEQRKQIVIQVLILDCGY